MAAHKSSFSNRSGQGGPAATERVRAVARLSSSGSKRSVPVTMRALTQRLNRLLAAEGKQLIKTRGAPAVDALGAYYIVVGSNAVHSHHVDLETLGRELGVLAAYEHLIERRR